MSRYSTLAHQLEIAAALAGDLELTLKEIDASMPKRLRFFSSAPVLTQVGQVRQIIAEVQAIAQNWKNVCTNMQGVDDEAEVVPVQD